MDRERQLRDSGVLNITVSRLLKQLNCLMLTSEKKHLQDKIISLLEGSNEEFIEPFGYNRLNRHIYTNTLPTLLDDDITEERMIAIIKRHQYHLHEERLSEELRKMAQLDVDPFTSSANRATLALPDIRSPTPIKPTALLDRVLAKHKMGKGITIPTMTPDLTEVVPMFAYEHDSGNGRNLPGQPELIRMLTDPEMNLAGKTVDGLNRSKSLLSLYGGTMSPPLIEKNKQRSKRRRKMLCKFCRKPPGEHQKWCVYYGNSLKETEEMPKRSKSFTDGDIYSWKIPKKKETPPTIIKPSKPTYDINKFKLDPERPDYSTLHRDVYVRALAYASARRVVKQEHAFLNQSTKPFVFSYYNLMDQPDRHEIDDGMKHIFGKRNTDFTTYYSLEVNRQNQQSEK